MSWAVNGKYKIAMVYNDIRVYGIKVYWVSII